MKYKTKNDHILNNKYEKKQYEEVVYDRAAWYDTSTEYWSSGRFTLWGRPTPSRKPIRNLYKEILRLSTQCTKVIVSS